MNCKAVFSLFFLFLFNTLTIAAQQSNPLRSTDFVAQKKWVDSVYNKMNLEEKLGQLFMLSASSNNSVAENDSLVKRIKEQHIGGVIFLKGNPVAQAKLTNQLQKKTNIPLLIGMDAEWGLAMRLDSTFALPWNMTLGAIQDTSLIRKAAITISQHSKRMGIQLNFAPVVDINTNPLNPIIGNRSFGERRRNVTSKALAFLRGMQEENVLAAAKHFPGHGDTNTDSHKTLPLVPFSRERLDSLELYPYRELIANGLSGIMVAHLEVPALESKQGLPSSLSNSIISGVLKKQYNFNGLIITDALNMKGAYANNDPGAMELEAFLAGNDILLMSQNVPEAMEKMKLAYYSKQITESRLSTSVKKILYAKYKTGLNHYKKINTNFLVDELNRIGDQVLFNKLTENSITLIKNNGAVLPVKKLEDKKIAYVSMGDAGGEAFLKELKKYTEVDWVQADKLSQLLEKLENYNYVIVGFHKPDVNPWAGYSFTEKELVWLHEISRKNKTVLSVFANPYSLLNIKSFTNLEGVIVGYQNNDVAQQKTAQVIFGALEAKGKLPVSIGNEFPEGTGYITKSLNRLAYGLPESEGMNSYKLKKIDSIIQVAIDERMTPGAQILVARHGKVIYQKNAGYYTYVKEKPVSDTTIYDLASLTKILATLPLIMEQVETATLNFDTRLGQMMPVFRNTNKENIRLQDMLMHYARLKPWIPFYVPTIDHVTKMPSKAYFRETPSERFSTHVAKDMYIRNDIQDTILNTIAQSSLLSKKEYRYSDLPFYILKYYLEGYYKTNLNTLTQEKFYKSLGANYTGYLPYTRFPFSEMAPAEIDKNWRFQKIQGYVHDQGAAMQGGIGGHAGLFSTANDVAKIMQMYLNGGNYGGKRYLKSETISKFNTCYYCDEGVRRGVGFDKPQLEKYGPTCNCVSMSSFGHSGFTGTFAWADPKSGIVYVFLSNRTFPDSANRKLIHADIRSKIQQAIQDAIDF